MIQIYIAFFLQQKKYFYEKSTNKRVASDDISEPKQLCAKQSNRRITGTL